MIKQNNKQPNGFDRVYITKPAQKEAQNKAQRTTCSTRIDYCRRGWVSEGSRHLRHRQQSMRYCKWCCGKSQQVDLRSSSESKVSIIIGVYPLTSPCSTTIKVHSRGGRRSDRENNRSWAEEMEGRY